MNIDSNFENWIKPVCKCSLMSSQLSIFPALLLLFCTPDFFLKWFNQHSPQFPLVPEYMFVKTLLYGSPISDDSENQKILEISIRYIQGSKDLVKAFYTSLYHLFSIVCNNIKKPHWS